MSIAAVEDDDDDDDDDAFIDKFSFKKAKAPADA
jgi:hypothetical protein